MLASYSVMNYCKSMMNIDVTLYCSKCLVAMSVDYNIDDHVLYNPLSLHI